MNKVKIMETMSLLDDELIGEASVNADTADETVGENISVTGVEAYRPNKWRRFALIAASFLLIAGVGAGGKLMIDNRAPMLPDDTPTMPFATEAATETRTAEETEAVQTEKPSSAAVAVKTEKADVQTASATVAVTEPEKETQPDEKAEEEVIEQTTVGDITEETEQIPSTTNDLVLREIVPKPTESQTIIQSDESIEINQGNGNVLVIAEFKEQMGGSEPLRVTKEESEMLINLLNEIKLTPVDSPVIPDPMEQLTGGGYIMYIENGDRILIMGNGNVKIGDRYYYDAEKKSDELSAAIGYVIFAHCSAY